MAETAISLSGSFFPESVSQKIRVLGDQIYLVPEEKADVEREQMNHLRRQWNARLSYPRVPLGFIDDKQVTPYERFVQCVVAWPSQPTYTSNWAWTEEGELLNRYDTELVERETKKRNIYLAYVNRIKELRGFAADDDDCSDIREASETDFWSFVKTIPLAKKAGVFLLDNGNLRAVWKGDEKTHIGLQFLGGQSTRYVIFKRRPASEKVSRVSGIDTLEGVKKQVRAFGITMLENG